IINESVVAEYDVLAEVTLDGVHPGTTNNQVIVVIAEDGVIAAIVELVADNIDDQAGIGQALRARYLVDDAMVANDDVMKVPAFTWANNDYDPIPGWKDEFYASIQNILLGEDVAAEMARLDQVWDETAQRLGLNE
ncbi:MAG: hypothetical protein ACK2T5_15310, partial [Anaerolineales bacterium]